MLVAGSLRSFPFDFLILGDKSRLKRLASHNVFSGNTFKLRGLPKA